MTAPKHSFPTTFPSDNTHRVVVFQPDLSGTDFDRLEDLAADALRIARAALADIEDLPCEVFKPIQREDKILREAIARRRILTEDARIALEQMLRQLARVEPDAATAPLLDRLMRRLRDALNGSHRVADLLAAEKDIGWHRGIGR